MDTTLTAPATARDVREQMATRLIFFLAGFALAAWAPLVPFVKEAAGLGERDLGLLLLCLGTGSILSMPPSGAAAQRFGCRAVVLAGCAVVALALPVLAASGNLLVLGAALMVFGAGMGATDCVINMQAILVERAAGRPMMSGFHGMFSVGGLVGAASATAMLWAGVPAILTASGVAAVIFALMGLAAGGLLPQGPGGDGRAPIFAVPHGVVLFIGVLCFILFLSEGSILDWSAVFLAESRGVAAARAGLGYVAFALTMTAGRLVGDAIVGRFGPARILVVGPAVAALGLAVVTFVPDWRAAIVGFGLVGVGCSNVVPVLFTAAGRQRAMPEHIALPAISTVGYAGVLIGPAVIGFLAQAIGLPAAFAVVAALLLGVAATGRFLSARIDS